MELKERVGNNVGMDWIFFFGNWKIGKERVYNTC